MTMFIPILVLIAIMSRFGEAPPTLEGAVGPTNALLVSLAIIVAPPALGWPLTRKRMRGFDRTGSLVDVARVGRMLAFEQMGAGLLTAAAIMWVGLLDAVRASIGDLVVVDELAACLPWVLATCIISAQSHSLEVRLRGAAMVGALDQGVEISAHHGLLAWMWLRLRETVLCTLAPGLVFLLWIEIAERGIGWIDGLRPGLLLVRDASGRAGSTGIADALVSGGMVAIAIASPLIVAAILPTVRVRSGRLVEIVAAICRATGTRCPPVRLWKPSMGQANAMVMGVVPGTRAVLVSERLVAGMSDEQLGAVLAHEIGHVKLRHIPWIAGSLIGTSIALHAVSGAIGHPGGPGAWSLLAIVIVIGLVSRRFERQADLFAAEALERMGMQRQDACRTMFEALLRVAEMNRVAITRRDHLHGSIKDRLDRLVAIARDPTAGVRTHRIAAWTKRAIGAGLIAAAAGWFLVG